MHRFSRTDLLTEPNGVCKRLSAIMDEEQTQNTQPFSDPRRSGDSSLLREEDEVDILCILRPCTPAAYHAVKLVASSTPQHILQNKDTSEILRCGDQSLLEEGKSSQADSESGSLTGDVARPPRETFKRSGPTLDIALRLSSKLKDPCLGFTFGRLPEKSDIVLIEESNVRISGMHFRIFVKENSVPMIEDRSINGTLVDGIQLGGSEAKTVSEKRRMLTTGCRIEAFCDASSTNEYMMRFIVEIPKRPRFPDQWRLKLGNYLQFVYQLERQASVRNEALRKVGVMNIAPVSL